MLDLLGHQWASFTKISIIKICIFKFWSPPPPPFPIISVYFRFFTICSIIFLQTSEVELAVEKFVRCFLISENTSASILSVIFFFFPII